MNYFITFLSAMVVTLLVTPFIIKIAVKYRIVDKPNDRKAHTKEMPYLGGVSIYLGFLISSIVAYYFGDFSTEPNNFFFALILGGTSMVIIGAIDDKFDMSAKTKFLLQIIVASAVVFMDIKIEEIFNPFSGELVSLGFWSVPITIIWIVGLTNAINLIDGLDGLAAGVSGIATLSFFIVSLMVNQFATAFLAIALLGAIIGFLFFNFHPAKLFMGDSGSLFLGFSLSLLTLPELKQITFFTFLAPIMILAIPILDTSYAMVRRKINHQPIFQPDKHHLHHQLMENGLSHRSTVLVIYSISATFALFGILLPKFDFWIGCLVTGLLLLIFQVIAESIGLLSENKKFITKVIFRQSKK